MTITYNFAGQVALVTGAAFGMGLAAFNNAGVQVSASEIADQSAEAFYRVKAINLRGVWACMKHELLQMRKQGCGAIVNCSSIGGLAGRALLAAYHGSKHGVLGLTSSVALEYAERGIRVNAVCPGTHSACRAGFAGCCAQALVQGVGRRTVARRVDL